MNIDYCPFFDTTKCIAFVVEPQNKGTMLASRELLFAIEAFYLRSGSIFVTMSKESFKTAYVTFPFKNFSPFFETFNNKLDEMISAGIIQHWRKLRDRIKDIEEKIPQVLEIDDLEMGFFVCIFFLTISLIVFVIELTMPYIISKWNNVKTSLVVKALLSRHIRMPQ